MQLNPDEHFSVALLFGFFSRYHTEGSRGAVKDRGQNGFPTVQLRGYDVSKPAILQVFVGSDTGTPIPHLYYQACKVSGKNSTQCR